MYQHYSKRWSKHLDFIIIDAIAIQIVFFFACHLRRISNVFRNPMYLGCALVLFLSSLLFSVFTDNHRDILKRGMFQEFKSVLGYVFFETAMMVCFLFATQEGEQFSRLVSLYFVLFGIALLWLLRTLWKKHVVAQGSRRQKVRHLFIITQKDMAARLIGVMKKNSVVNLEITGITLVDDHSAPKKDIQGIPVMSNMGELVSFLQDKWVDEVMIYLPRDVDISERVVNELYLMGLTIHRVVDIRDLEGHGHRSIENVAGCTCITQSIRIASTRQVFIKRIMDICVGLVGVVLTGVLTLILGPLIYITDPGPIFYSQERVGKNGRVIKIYKFRSMYQDADARKQELIRKMHLEDQIMFKMKYDPRILGSGPDGTKKGIGWFIRTTSLDEFPQFLSVLAGDMSVVGTRPPTLDEFSRYELHHRARLAIKPGLSGIWQTSGRSNITDFEEVVKMDLEYINNWTIGMDIKIILKTIMVMFTHEGAE